MHAIVLAGQPNRGLLKVAGTHAYEAEIPIGGRPMAWWVIDALAASPSISSIALVGPESLRRDAVIWSPVAGDLFSNILAGLKTAPVGAEHVLFVTSDIPWITAAAVEAFVTSAPRDVDIVYPIIPKRVAEERFPGTKRTYVRLVDGIFTGGNLFLARAKAVPRLKERAEVLLSHRKSPLALARDVGLGLLVRLITGRLSVQQAEIRVGGILGISGRALIFPYAEAGVDVDKPEDLILAQRYMVDGSEADGDIS